MTRLKHRRIQRKPFNGVDDEKSPLSSLSNENKHMDFTELEHIFDNAIRNELPMEIYKQKSQNTNLVLEKEDNCHRQSLPKSEDTRIELSNQPTEEPVPKIKRNFIHKIKQHKILSAISVITLSAMTGFFSIFIFIK